MAGQAVIPGVRPRRRPLRSTPRARCPKFGKVMYTHGEGLMAITQMDATSDDTMQLYRCESCGAYHIGHPRVRFTRNFSN